MHTTSETCAGKIVPFTEKSLEKCREKQALRQQQKKSKFRHIVLPEVANGLDGYHTQCFRLFTAIKPRKTLGDINQNENGTYKIPNGFFIIINQYVIILYNICRKDHGSKRPSAIGQ